MRLARTLVACTLGLAAATLSACADPPPACNPETLRLQVQLKLDATLADTITVQSLMTPLFTRSFARTPNPDDTKLFYIDLAFSDGYPANKLVSLLVSASVKGQVIDTETAQIHLQPVCTVAPVTLINYLGPMSPTDGGPPTD